MSEIRVLAGRYRITNHLARGGMGDVFEAEDELLGRRVAVKLLHQQFARDEAFVARFRREAQAAANLNHPNIVSIYDWGQYEHSYFMVMELIDGQTLREVTKSEGLVHPRRGAEIIAEVAAALTVAHEAGVYHRDVKPGNIMLTPNGSVKVTDFGIARALDDSEELTRTGAVIGTATYFSPEQAQGLPADARSDVYSLGVVLYELVGGRPPFQGESPVAVAYQHVSEWAKPVSSLNPSVDAQLEAIIDRAMHKDPSTRYQSAAEMRNDLLAYLRGDAPTAAPITQGAPVQAAAPLPPPPTATPDETARHVSTFPEDDRANSIGSIVGIVGLLILLGVGLFILFRLLSGGGTAEAATETIPDVSNSTIDDAFDLLQEQGFRVSQREQPSDDIPLGFVIATDPGEGTVVERGSRVTVIVSVGPQQFPVPPLDNLSLDVAESRITEQGFVLGDVETRFSEDVAEGLVIDQQPAAGANAPPGTPISLVVSSGPFALTVPEIEGQTEEDAVASLETEGFEVVVELEFSEDIAEGFAIRTEPGADQLVGRDNPIVTLFVSDGPEPFGVPNFVGLGIEEARQLAFGLGLELIIEDAQIEVTLASGLDGKVAVQDPAEGTEVTADDQVRLRIGTLRLIEVPNLTRLTEDEARTLLESMGLVLFVIDDTIPVDFESGLDGLIIGQDPAAGNEIREGDQVGVQIGLAEPPPTTTTTVPPTTTTTAAP